MYKKSNVNVMLWKAALLTVLRGSVYIFLVFQASGLAGYLLASKLTALAKQTLKLRMHVN